MSTGEPVQLLGMRRHHEQCKDCIQPRRCQTHQAYRADNTRPYIYLETFDVYVAINQHVNARGNCIILST